MSIGYARRDPWPTRQEELLLRAALLHGPDALAAWDQWKSIIDFDDIDSESYRLVPRLYCSLRDQGVADPLLGRLRGIYRRTWYQNQLRFHAMARPLRLLHAAGIPTMLLKGAALVLQYYRDYGMRPMTDFDICVPGNQASTAIELLRADGFTPRGAPEEALLDAIAHPDRHSELEFADAAGHEFDVHWRLFPESIAPDVSAPFWQDTVEMEALGTPTRALKPADQLLHVCVHGIVRGAVGYEVSRVRWMMDVMTILRTSGDAVDWTRLLAQADRCGFIPPLRAGLTYLQRTLDAPIPTGVLQQLRTMPVPLTDRIVHAARTQPPEHWGPWLTVCVGYVEHSRSLPPGTGALRTLAGMPGYYRRRWRAARVWSLPFDIAFRGMRRVGWTVRRYGTGWTSRLTGRSLSATVRSSSKAERR
ncbi:MAG TPA: nucleotidyltransferase family protein [bacterium]|nr:nucleotidyltransferase family protein [bacterium]